MTDLASAAAHPVVTLERRLVFAHRGGAALGPENTLAAFARGLAHGADGLEIDVRLARDGVAVVHHDPTLERTTDGRGRVADFTAGELARFDAAYLFDAGAGYPLRGRGIGIPALRDVLEAFPAALLIVELKGGDPALARAAVADVRRAGAAGRVCLGAYSQPVIREVRLAAPEIVTSAAREEVRWALYRSWVGLPHRRVPYRAFQVPERAGATRVVSRRFVAAAHRAGLAVQVWTVNEEPDMRRLLSWGVDGLISDRPDVAVKVRNEGLAE